MTLELLISTMHRQDHTLLEKMKIRSDAVVVNQCDINGREEFDFQGHKILWINTTQRGLSRSRNMAIQNARADICMLADDDLEYRENYPQTVLEAFAKNEESHIIGFQVAGIEGKFKDYSAQEQDVGLMASMKMASVELAFRRESFLEKKIAFDELIGAGTEFLMGEENALLFSCLRKGIKIHYVPAVIADLHIGESTWFTGRDERYFMGKGASFAAMGTIPAWVLILQFAIRKYALYKEECSFLNAVKFMNRGKKRYRAQKKH